MGWLVFEETGAMQSRVFWEGACPSVTARIFLLTVNVVPFFSSNQILYVRCLLTPKSTWIWLPFVSFRSCVLRVG